jgi:3',5'-cyclic AMP phosphodiesterase CpdA
MALSRRDFLAGITAGTAALSLSPSTAEAAEAVAQSGRGLRICFFTDAHVPMPKEDDPTPAKTLEATDRLKKAFAKANTYKPQLFVFGGDNVMAVDQGNTEAHTDAQFANWSKQVKENVKVKHISVIGNHDIWVPKENKPADPKAKAVAAFSMPHRYYRHDQAGWTFLLLDVFHTSGPSGLDKEQFAWMESEVKKTTNPVCLVSHSPFFGPSLQLDGDPLGGKMELRKLLLKNPQVKLGLGGHQHWIDRCELDHMTYLTGGAVSGAWWDGPYQEFDPAFLIIDLNPKGEIKVQKVFWER